VLTRLAKFSYIQLAVGQPIGPQLYRDLYGDSDSVHTSIRLPVLGDLRMKAIFERAFSGFAVTLAIGLVVSAGCLNGQTNAQTSTGSPSAPAGQVQIAQPPPPPQALNGTWNLNADKSDDAEEKLRGTPEGDNPLDDGPVPSAGQGTPSGSGRRSGAPYGRPGGAGPLGGPLPVGADAKANQKMFELLRPAASLTVETKDSEFDLTDENSRKRAFYTDGRKLQKPKDESYKEIAAVWTAGRLTFDEKGPRGEKITVTFQMARDARQLIETTQVDKGKIYSPVVIRYIYDAATDSK
jgi:hypothetical protein